MNWYLKTFLIVLGTAVVLWAIAIFAAQRLDFYISENDVVITVMGIVAGIVVIGNYAQVHDLEKRYEKRISDLETFVDLLSDKLIKDNNGQEYREQDTQSS